MTPKASWKDYILAILLAAGMIAVALPVKLACTPAGSHHPVGIMLKYVIYGAAAGIVLGAVCLLGKKKQVPFFGALLVLAVMTFLPTSIEYGFSVFLGAYLALCILSVPFLAAKIGRI